MIPGEYYYIHDIPGRLRIKTPVIKNNPDCIYQIRRLFEEIEGIKRISENMVTGSIIFYYDPHKIGQKQILEILKVNEIFDETRAITNDQYIQTAVSKGSHAVGRAVLGWVVSKALEGAGLSFLAVLI